jgi:cyanophycin synthetase
MSIELSPPVHPRTTAANQVPATPATVAPLWIREARVYRGPSIYAYRRVIRLHVELGALEDYPSDRLGNFTAELLRLVPTLEEHTCSYGTRGGFVRRLREGTWLGHIVEHVALELQCLAGTEVSYGKTRGTGERPGSYFIVYSYNEERVGLRAGWIALRLVESLLPPELRGFRGLDELCPDRALEEEFDYASALEGLIRLAGRVALGPTTQSIVDEARRRRIPVLRLDEESLVQLGYGKYQQYVRASVTGRTSNIAVENASDKELTSRLLHDVGLPVPRNILVYSADEAAQAAAELGYPVVTKPLDVSHGRGVSLNLTTPEQVRWGFAQAAEHRRAVLVEQFLRGRDYRVLVIHDKVVAVAERVPAHVVGDGEHRIAELVEMVNRDPRRGIGHEKVLTQITIDDQARRLLAQAGYGLKTVLRQGEIFHLRSTANISTGGTAIDRTGQMHYDNVEIARRAARVIGLDIAGIDIISPDITKSLRETGGGIVEVNAGPGFRMHLQPSEGTPRNVAAPVLDMLFPPGAQSRVPVIAITGTNGKTTTSRMVAHILQLHGRCVGLTTTDGIYIDGELYLAGDTTGPWSAGVVLKHPGVEAAVLETARGGILREGLGFQRCDVGAVLNVQADHLGLRGVETLEDLAAVKSLVAEVVRDDGVSVLNADDPLTVAMRERAGGKVMYFSMHGNGDSELLRAHIAGGGMAAVLQHAVNGDMIAIYDGDQYIPVLWSHHIPATMEGRAAFNVANALAAAAIAYALQIPIQTIRQGLTTFSSSFTQNPGRLNVYDELPFRVIVDYGHNPAAMARVHDLVKKLRPQYQRVRAVLTGVGDRRDEDIWELGREAASMVDELIVKEDGKLRGRAPGEIAGLIKEGALAGGLPESSITTILPELEAVAEALRRGQQGDLVLLFADDVPGVWNQLTSFREAAKR